MKNSESHFPLHDIGLHCDASVSHTRATLSVCSVQRKSPMTSQAPHRIWLSATGLISGAKSNAFLTLWSFSCQNITVYPPCSVLITEKETSFRPKYQLTSSLYSFVVNQVIKCTLLWRNSEVCLNFHCYISNVLYSDTVRPLLTITTSLTL